MRFAPKSQNELASMNLINPGQYQFEVAEAKEAKSKSGNDMIALKLKIWDQNNHERIVFDYLLEKMPFKLRHFAESVGLIDKYELGYINADDCKHKCGYLELAIEKDREGRYPDKNAVRDYISAKKKEEDKQSKSVDEFLNDDLPF